MAIPSGLAGQVGIKAESTYGTYVAPDRFYEPVAEVSFGLTKITQQGGGVAAGRLSQPGNVRVVTGRGGTGTLQIEGRQSKLGLLLSHIFGNTPTPTQQNTSTGYLSAFTLNDLFGKFLTIQSGVPDVTGTVRPYSFLGCKVVAAEFACAMDGLLTISVDFDFRDVTEAQALATASYPTTSQKPFGWQCFSLKLGTYASEAAISGVRGFTLRIERPADVDRRYAGNAGLKSEQISNDFVAVTGTIEADYYTKADLADRFASDSSTAAIFSFEDTAVSLTGSPTIYPKLDLRVSQMFLNEGTPKLNGPGVVTTSYSFVGQNDLTNPVVACNYISTDTAL